MSKVAPEVVVTEKKREDEERKVHSSDIYVPEITLSKPKQISIWLFLFIIIVAVLVTLLMGWLLELLMGSVWLNPCGSSFNSEQCGYEQFVQYCSENRSNSFEETCEDRCDYFVESRDCTYIDVCTSLNDDYSFSFAFCRSAADDEEP